MTKRRRRIRKKWTTEKGRDGRRTSKEMRKKNRIRLSTTRRKNR